MIHYKLNAFCFSHDQCGIFEQQTICSLLFSPDLHIIGKTGQKVLTETTDTMFPTLLLLPMIWMIK